MTYTVTNSTDRLARTLRSNGDGSARIGRLSPKGRGVVWIWPRAHGLDAVAWVEGRLELPQVRFA